MKFAAPDNGLPEADREFELPAWFVQARDRADGRRGSVMHEGCRIAYQAWGRPGQDPLLLLHGAGASSEWWEATAILLAESFHIVAPNFSGVGRSQWRESYHIDQSLGEALACAAAEGVAGPGVRPVCVAHSFGSETGVRLAIDPARPISQLVLVDTLLGLHGSGPSVFPLRERQYYPALEDASRRFSTVPRDDFGPRFLREHVARQSLELVDSPVGGPLWSWRADPNVLTRMTCDSIFSRMGDARCPLDFIFGGRSSMNSPELRSRQARLAGADAEFLEIEEAGHHIPLDQPEKLALAIRQLVAKRRHGLRAS